MTEAEKPARKPRRLAFKLAALFFALVFAFGIAEVAARIKYPGAVGQLQDGGTDEDIRRNKGIRLPPAQKVVGPPGVMTGLAGVGLMVTFVAAEGALAQPFVVTMTV